MPEFIKKITKKQWQRMGKNAVVLILLFALLFAVAVMSLNAVIISVTEDRILPSATAAKLTDIAIWAFHGTSDTTVPPKGTSDMESAIKAAGGTKIRATYLAGVGHSCWDQAYATSGLVDWLLAQSK